MKLKERPLVVIVAPVHRYDDVRVFHKQACSLKESGYRVKLISRSEEKKNVGGVEVVPAWGSYRNRALRFISLLLVAIQALRYNADVYHLHNPDTIPVALFLKMCRKKVVYDTHEDFQKRILMRRWIPRRLRKPVAAIVTMAEAFASRICDYTIVTQEPVANRMHGEVAIIKNAPRVDDSVYSSVASLAESVGSKGCDFRLVYVGGVSVKRGLAEMVEALSIVNEKYDCRLWLIGPDNEGDIEKFKDCAGWEYVDYMERMPQEQAFSYIMNSDLGVVYISDVGDHAYTDPNKMYEYMTFGKPFIASDFPLWKERLSGVSAGFFVRADSLEDFADALLEILSYPENILEEMGDNGRRFVKSYSWEAEFAKLRSIYAELIQ